MHGAVHDFITVKTVKGGEGYPSAEEMYGGAVRDYITYKYKPVTEQPIFKSILEIGSLDICGSAKTYNFINRGPSWRSIVGNQEYIGLDLIPCNCVDVVGNSHDIPFPGERFDLVMCMNMLEHDSDPAKTIKEAYRVLRTGQPFLLTTVNQNWGEHPQLGGGDTETYNKITKAKFTKWIKDAGFTNPEIIEWNNNLFCEAIK